MVYEKRILEAIGERSAHGYELADRLGIPTSSIYDHLKDLSESPPWNRKSTELRDG